MGLWGVWSMFGKPLFEALVDTVIETATKFHELIDEDESFEASCVPTCNIVVFRYLPAELRECAAGRNRRDPTQTETLDARIGPGVSDPDETRRPDPFTVDDHESVDRGIAFADDSGAASSAGAGDTRKPTRRLRGTAFVKLHNFGISAATFLSFGPGPFLVSFRRSE